MPKAISTPILAAIIFALTAGTISALPTPNNPASPAPSGEDSAFCADLAKGDAAKQATCLKAREFVNKVTGARVTKNDNEPEGFSFDYLKEGEGVKILTWRAKRALGLG